MDTDIGSGCNVMEKNKERMLGEADDFRRNMPGNLQSGQRDAILKAMTGDSSMLEKVRNSRNAAIWELSGVRSRDVAPDMRLYLSEKPKNGHLPLLLYFHGGGWTFGSINSCARFCSKLALSGSVAVLSVNYRLAPEFPFPCALEDCAAALAYARLHAEEWGCDSRHISVGGDSSGGNLAMALSLYMDRCRLSLPNSLLLFYPVVSAWNDNSRSWKEYAEGAALDGRLMEVFNQAYCQGVNGTLHENAYTNPLISPSVAEFLEK